MRAKVLYNIYPYDKSIWQMLRNPKWCVAFVLSVWPVWGLQPIYWLLVWASINRRDEYQLVSFILEFKAPPRAPISNSSHRLLAPSLLTPSLLTPSLPRLRRSCSSRSGSSACSSDRWRTTSAHTTHPNRTPSPRRHACRRLPPAAVAPAAGLTLDPHVHYCRELGPGASPFFFPYEITMFVLQV